VTNEPKAAGSGVLAVLFGSSPQLQVVAGSFSDSAALLLASHVALKLQPLVKFT
jgi:hypothetical protein